MIFDAYAAYYDLLYRDKDYTSEATYLHELIASHVPAATSVLDLGCGTGKHAQEFVKLGYQLTGVDQSARMIELAHELNPSDSSKFEVGDVRTFRSSKKFEVVLSLFHVMSYQATDTDLQSAFATAAANLQPGGIFMFDCWFAPGVLSDAPTVVRKQMQNENILVERTATPTHDEKNRTINVHFDVAVTEIGTGAKHQLQEDHLMRYLNKEEVEELGTKSGFEMIASHPWMSVEELGDKKCWYALFVLQKQ
jgi:SAM-dependent methyltransferase